MLDRFSKVNFIKNASKISPSKHFDIIKLKDKKSFFILGVAA